jgi:hypothetical protein
MEHLSRHRGKSLRACHRPDVGRLRIGGRVAAGRLPRKLRRASGRVNALQARLRCLLPEPLYGGLLGCRVSISWSAGPRRVATTGVTLAMASIIEEARGSSH